MAPSLRLVRLSDPAYRRLYCLAGKLQQRMGKRFSLGDAVEYLLARSEAKTPKYWRKVRGKQKP